MPELRVLVKKDPARWTSADCMNASRVLRRVDHLRAQGCGPGTIEALRRLGVSAHCGLGRVSHAGKVAHERSRLLTVPEAQARIAARGPVPEKLPAHVKPYANYMASRAGKRVSRRDFVKAYVITRSSIRRKERTVPTVCKYYPEYAQMKRMAFRGAVRPEDAMAVLLFTPHGQQYLDAAERGVLDRGAAEALVERMRCFGLTVGLMDDLREGATGLNFETNELNRAFRGPRKNWIEFVRDKIPGVSASKAGFVASLLGRGDIPTFDAREQKLWRRRAYTREPGVPELEAFSEKIREYPLALDPAHEPFREHLVHHTLWDAYPERGKQTKTTHGTVIRAMQFAGRRR